MSLTKGTRIAHAGDRSNRNVLMVPGAQPATNRSTTRAASPFYYNYRSTPLGDQPGVSQSRRSHQTFNQSQVRSSTPYAYSQNVPPPPPPPTGRVNGITSPTGQHLGTHSSMTPRQIHQQHLQQQHKVGLNPVGVDPANRGRRRNAPSRPIIPVSSNYPGSGPRLVSKSRTLPMRLPGVDHNDEEVVETWMEADGDLGSGNWLPAILSPDIQQSNAARANKSQRTSTIRSSRASKGLKVWYEDQEGPSYSKNYRRRKAALSNNMTERRDRPGGILSNGRVRPGTQSMAEVLYDTDMSQENVPWDWVNRTTTNDEWTSEENNGFYTPPLFANSLTQVMSLKENENVISNGSTAEDGFYVQLPLREQREPYETQTLDYSCAIEQGYNSLIGNQEINNPITYRTWLERRNVHDQNPGQLDTHARSVYRAREILLRDWNLRSTPMKATILKTRVIEQNGESMKVPLAMANPGPQPTPSALHTVDGPYNLMPTRLGPYPAPDDLSAPITFVISPMPKDYNDLLPSDMDTALDESAYLSWKGRYSESFLKSILKKQKQKETVKQVVKYLPIIQKFKN